MVVLETLQVPPRDIRFTQDSISEAFGDRGDQAPIDPETIEDTFRKLLYGDVSVNSLRKISVVRKDNRMWVVSGNRRLYVFKKLQEHGRISTVPINVVALNKERFEKMFTTKNEGQSIYIRQDRKHSRGNKLEDRLRMIYNNWVAHGRPTDGYPSEFAHRESLDDSLFSGGSTWSPRTPPAPRASYVEPTWPVVQPRPQSARQPRPPPAQQQDDSWCAIL